MTASITLNEDVLAAFDGLSRVSSLNFLKNFNKSRDKADSSRTGAVSTKIFYDTRTLAGSASENLDLAAGNLTGPDGAAVTFTKVHGIYIRPVSANAGAVQVGNAASNGFVGPFSGATGALNVGPGDHFVQTSKVGWTVTAGTGDILKVANQVASAVTYDIVIAGE